MEPVPHADEHPGSRKPKERELDWQPSSGEGAAAALREVQRIERVKSSWRRVRSGLPPADGEQDSPDA